MAATIDEITIEYSEGDVLTTKQLEKEVLTKGAWTTILFKYQDFDKKLDDYGPIKYCIRRYQKRNGEYKTKSKFNISNTEQAKKVIAILDRWISEDPANASANDSE